MVDFSQELLPHAERLRRLAAALVADAAAADDLAQDVWVRALERPPRREGPLWPWLASVTRRLAIDRLRSGARRRQREAARARPESVEPLREAEERLHLSTRLVAALHALPPPERDVVLLVHMQELSHGASAKALDIPLPTLRARLTRARRRLRERLEKELCASESAGPRDLHVGLVALAGPALGNVRSQARHLAGWTSASKSTSTWITGGLLRGLLMTTTTKIAAVAAVLLIGFAAWTSWPTSSDSPRSSLPETSDAQGANLPSSHFAPVPTADSRISVPLAAGQEDRPPQQPEPEQFGRYLRGSVRLPVGFDPTEVIIEVQGRGSRFASDGPRELRTSPGSDGSFDLEISSLFEASHPIAPAELLVSLRAAGCMTVHRYLSVAEVHPVQLKREELKADAVWRIDENLERGFTVLGRVLGPDAGPVANAVVHVYQLEEQRNGSFLPSSIPVGRSPVETDGTFEVVVRNRMHLALVAAAQDLLPATTTLSATELSDGKSRTLRLSAGVTVEGRLEAFGKTLQGGQVELRLVRSRLQGTNLEFETPSSWEHSPSRLRYEGELVFPTYAGANADEKGHFLIENLLPGEYEVSVGLPSIRASLSGHYPPGQIVRAPARGLVLGPTPALIRLDPTHSGATERGDVHFQIQEGSPGATSLQPDELSWIEAPPRASVELSFRFPGRAPYRTVIALGEGGSVSDVVLPKLPLQASVELVLVLSDDKQREAITQLNVNAWTAEYSGETDEWEQIAGLKRDDEGGGRTRVGPLPPGPTRIRVRPWDADAFHPDGLWLPFERELNLKDLSELELPVRFEEGARLSVRLFDSTGQSIPGKIALLDANGQALDVLFIGRRDGAMVMNTWRLEPLVPNFVDPPLAPGKYTFVANEEGNRESRVEVTLAAGERRELEVRLEAE